MRVGISPENKNQSMVFDIDSISIEPAVYGYNISCKVEGVLPEGFNPSKAHLTLLQDGEEIIK